MRGIRAVPMALSIAFVMAAAGFEHRAEAAVIVDDVLPFKGLKVAGSGVFRPTADDRLFRFVGSGFPGVSSDHCRV